MKDSGQKQDMQEQKEVQDQIRESGQVIVELSLIHILCAGEGGALECRRHPVRPLLSAPVKRTDEK